jgi:subtilisin family serine protease
MVICSAGNFNDNVSKYLPANSANVYVVSSSDDMNKRAKFSNYGSNVRIAAPGVYITSTYNGKYAYGDGTSFSASIVVGVAAMIKAQDPKLTANEIKDILSKSATDIDAKGFDVYTGYGLIDAKKAIESVQIDDSKEE